MEVDRHRKERKNSFNRELGAVLEERWVIGRGFDCFKSSQTPMHDETADPQGNQCPGSLQTHMERSPFLNTVF